MPELRINIVPYVPCAADTVVEGFRVLIGSKTPCSRTSRSDPSPCRRQEMPESSKDTYFFTEKMATIEPIRFRLDSTGSWEK